MDFVISSRIVCAASAAASTTAVIPAGQTRYFAIRGDVTLAGVTYNVNTFLLGDSKFLAQLASGPDTKVTPNTFLATTTFITNAAAADNNFIWRPFSTTSDQTGSDNLRDFSTGYGIVGLPNAGTSRQVLTQ